MENRKFEQNQEEERQQATEPLGMRVAAIKDLQGTSWEGPAVQGPQGGGECH